MSLSEPQRQSEIFQLRDDLADTWNVRTYPDWVGINKDGLNRLEHAVPCMCMWGECICSDLKIHINSEEYKNFSLLTLDLTGQLKLTSTQTSTEAKVPMPVDCDRVVQICCYSGSCYKEFMLTFKCYKPVMAEDAHSLYKL